MYSWNMQERKNGGWKKWQVCHMIMWFGSMVTGQYARNVRELLSDIPGTELLITVNVSIVVGKGQP